MEFRNKLDDELESSLILEPTRTFIRGETVGRIVYELSVLR